MSNGIGHDIVLNALKALGMPERTKNVTIKIGIDCLPTITYETIAPDGKLVTFIHELGSAAKQIAADESKQ